MNTNPIEVMKMARIVLELKDVDEKEKIEIASYLADCVAEKLKKIEIE